MSPAEERAAREGLPVVRLIPHEAMRIAEGNAMICELQGGGKALVRLFTAAEFLVVQHAAAQEYGAEKISLARAEQLVRPL